MFETHPHHQLQLAQHRQAEFLEDVQSNALARQLRPRRPGLLDGVADRVARRLQRRAVAVPRPSQA